MAIEFTDNSARVKSELEDVALAWLEEAGGELVAQVKRRTRVDTGQLKGSWRYTINRGKLEAKIGSPLENAIWEELGTGEFALNGNGRKTPWVYQDAKGNWHKTTGKRPKRALHEAFQSSRAKLKQSLEAKMREVR